MSRLELRKVSKKFDAVQALHEVDLILEPGEVTGLMGDNGAGKSVLIKVIGGLLKPDSGQVLCDGRVVAMSSPRISQQEGIAIVHQDLALCENLSAAENIFLGQEPIRRYGPLSVIDHTAIRNRATTLFDELESSTPPDALIKNLSGGQRQATAITRVLSGDANIILLDEPTAAISLVQVEDVLKLIKQLKNKGKAVLLVSHRMSDIFAVCDRIAVLWRGEKVADKPIKETSREEITNFITGANRRAA